MATAFASQLDKVAPLIISTVILPGGAVGIDGAVAGHSGTFLFDTGAGVTIVTPETVALSGCQVWGQITGFRATGQRLDTPRCDDVRITIGGRKFKAPIASVLDLQGLVGPGMPKLLGLLALDVFAGQTITIRPLAHEIIIETPQSLHQRLNGATEVPVRLVRDVEGIALTVDAAVPTAKGLAWMELDTGNLGPILIGKHVAPLLQLEASKTDTQPVTFATASGVPVNGEAKVLSLIMDGDIGQSTLKHWDLTLDLTNGKAWFRPASLPKAFPSP